MPGRPAYCHQPIASQTSAPFKWVAPLKSEKILEGFCPEPRQEEQLAVNSGGLMVFLRLADIEWLEAADNRVALHVGRETHLLRETLAAVAAKLPPDRFLRLSPSALVNVGQIKELRSLLDGQWAVLLRNGTRLILMHAYRENLRQLGLCRADSTKPLAFTRFTVGRSAWN